VKRRPTDTSERGGGGNPPPPRSSAHPSAREHGASAPSSRAQPQRDAAGLGTRRAACEILLRVDRDRAFADVLLGHRLGAFAPADRRLVTQLVLGTIAWRGRLDYELARVSARKLDSLMPEVLAILRLGLYQLRILTRVPRHAAVDTAVSLAHETSGGAGAARFVNAVMRRAIRSPVPPPARDADEIEYFAVTYSHPRWIVEKFLHWFGGDEAASLMAANNEAAPNVLRLNLARGPADELIARLERDGMQVAARGHFPETVILKGAPIFDSPSFREGLFHPQAEASQMVARMLAPVADSIVVDCAAAPGGKSAHLAQLVGSQGIVVALDLNLTGLKNARAVAARLGHRNISFVRADSTFTLPLRPACADYVLLDAPCTGIGTLREHPEIRWRLGPGDFTRMAATQARMLEQAAAIVKPGGALVYAVCSFAPEEGECIVREFLVRHPEFDLDRTPPHGAALAGTVDSDGFMRTRPDRGALDGFFAARITRRPL
jgi:16S rRNA (cytosine967-C5)-methyltransferase